MVNTPELFLIVQVKPYKIVGTARSLLDAQLVADTLVKSNDYRSSYIVAKAISVHEIEFKPPTTRDIEQRDIPITLSEKLAQDRALAEQNAFVIDPIEFMKR